MDMPLEQIVHTIAEILYEIDAESPHHKQFQPGIGPFGEPQLVKMVEQRLCEKHIPARTQRTPDLSIGHEWAIEFKIVRPFGDNGKEAENWSVNLLHPYPGNVSLLGDAIKLGSLPGYSHRGLFVVGFEHEPPIRNLEPLIVSFEVIASQVMKLALGERVEERRRLLIHPVHQVLRCIGWELHISR